MLTYQTAFHHPATFGGGPSTDAYTKSALDMGTTSSDTQASAGGGTSGVVLVAALAAGAAAMYFLLVRR